MIEYGKQYNNWLPLEASEKRDYSVCRCLLCGRVKIVNDYTIISGKSKSCGCQINQIEKAANARKAIIEKNADLRAVSIKQFVGKEINGFKILEMYYNASKNKMRCKAICPICQKEYEFNFYPIEKGIIKSCKDCMHNVCNNNFNIVHDNCIDDTNSLILIKRKSGTVNKNSKTGYNGISIYKGNKYRAYINFKKNNMRWGYLIN